MQIRFSVTSRLRSDASGSPFTHSLLLDARTKNNHIGLPQTCAEMTIQEKDKNRTWRKKNGENRCKIRFLVIF